MKLGFQLDAGGLCSVSSVDSEGGTEVGRVPWDNLADPMMRQGVGYGPEQVEALVFLQLCGY